MSSTFLGLTIASSGLSTYQTAINVTGNNIANVETKGYTRQAATQTASQALRAYTTYGQIGTGVTTTGIEQIRNSYYDTKFWSSNTRLGEYDAKDYYMEQIENVFDETKNTAGFTKGFSTFFSSLNTTAGSSLSVSNLTQFVNDAQTFAEYFNDLSTSLDKIQDDSNEEIKTYTDKINSIAQQIYTLNKQINVEELAGGTANTLRDQRALLVDGLSEIVPVEVTETEIESAQGIKTGATSYEVAICGQTLANCDGYNQLECVARTEKVNQSDIDGLYDIQWENGNQFNVVSSKVSGKLKALYDIRDGNNADNFRGGITDVTAVDANNTLVTISSSTFDDLNQMTLNGAGTITLGNKQYTYDSFSAEYNSISDDYNYTFNITSNNSQVTSALVGRSAAVGSSVDYYGVPYYMAQLNEFVRAFAETANSILTTGYNSSGELGGILYTGTSVTSQEYDFSMSGSIAAITEASGVSTVQVKADSTETGKPIDSGSISINGVEYDYDSYTFDSATNIYSYQISGSVDSSLVGKNADNYSLIQTNTSDSYYMLTAANLKVKSEMIKDPTLLGTTTDFVNDTDSGDVLTKLYGAKSDKNVLSFRGGTAEEFLSCIVSDVAVDSEKANTFSTKYNTLIKTIKNQRLSISGVDNDEEAVNLTKYQNAYELSCKLVSVLQEMYDKLINQTGV
ncbi:MAG: flagellar hook-associated protein FlgK [Lachnotalea sp.]